MYNIHLLLCTVHKKITLYTVHSTISIVNYTKHNIHNTKLYKSVPCTAVGCTVGRVNFCQKHPNMSAESFYCVFWCTDQPQKISA